jgi:hypothetical protein
MWRERRRNRRALRAAARLVAAELRTVQSRLHLTVASGVWRELSERGLAHGEWDEHRGSFAAQLSLERWEDLDSAYRLIRSVNAAAQQHQKSERLTAVDCELLDMTAESVGSAAALLEARSSANADGPRSAWRRTHRILPRHP